MFYSGNLISSDNFINCQCRHQTIFPAFMVAYQLIFSYLIALKTVLSVESNFVEAATNCMK